MYVSQHPLTYICSMLAVSYYKHIYPGMHKKHQRNVVVVVCSSFLNLFYIIRMYVYCIYCNIWKHLYVYSIFICAQTLLAYVQIKILFEYKMCINILWRVWEDGWLVANCVLKRIKADSLYLMCFTHLFLAYIHTHRVNI